MNFKSLKKQQGIGLLELMLSLAIIAILLVMATRYYQSAHQGEQMNQMVGIVQNVRAASADWVAGKPNYNGVSAAELISYGLIPKDIENGSSIRTPWDGATVSVNAAGANSQQVNVVVSGMPTWACKNIEGKFTGQGSATCNGTTLTVLF